MQVVYIYLLIKTMPTRKRVLREPTPQSETLNHEPVMVGEGRYSSKHKLVVYDAVDFQGTRFRLGDHVSMYTPEGYEWVCVLETLFQDPKTEQAMFKGRWFWSVDDVAALQDSHMEPMRQSKCPTHELFACDNRDDNLVESISRKCCVLSYDNFQLVKKTVMKPDFSMGKVFFCERQFYHRAYRFSELNSLLFPGDPIPDALRKAAGLPLIPSSPEDDGIDTSNAYYEPEYAAKLRRKKSDKSLNVSSDPKLLW